MLQASVALKPEALQPNAFLDGEGVVGIVGGRGERAGEVKWRSGWMVPPRKLILLDLLHFLSEMLHA